MESIWEKSTRLPHFEPLSEDISVDALVIGGGLCGLITLWKLQKRGISAALIEADRICSHTSGHTTAKITSGHSLIYRKIAKKYGISAAQKYLTANETALEEYRKLSEEIDCDFEEKDNYIYSTGNLEAIEDEAAVLKKIGFPASVVRESELPIKIAGALKYPRQAQFNPLKFAKKIVEGARIYEKTRALDIKDGRVITDKGVVRAKKIVVATRFPIVNRVGLFFMKMYQYRSYVIALDGDFELDGMYVDAQDGGLSFRGYKGSLLLGGGGHRTGDVGGGFTLLEEFAKQHYNVPITARFATEDTVTLDGVPYIGKYSKMTRNLYTATGFNKWGMTSSMLAANILCDELEGRKNEFSDVFSPSRSMLSMKLISNGAHTALGFVTPRVPRCSHLGCALKWNKEEHSWDCPCHGSRFSKEGELIDGPANRRIF